MAKLTFLERWFPWRIHLDNWSLGKYYQIRDDVDGYPIKMFQEYFSLTCGVCHKFTTGCGKDFCSFCGVCPSCNEELDKMYKEELHT